VPPKNSRRRLLLPGGVYLKYIWVGKVGYRSTKEGYIRFKYRGIDHRKLPPELIEDCEVTEHQVRLDPKFDVSLKEHMKLLDAWHVKAVKASRELRKLQKRGEDRRFFNFEEPKQSNDEPSNGSQQEASRSVNQLTISDLKDFGEEKRIPALRLGERLGLSRARGIRTTIDDNREELETYGELVCCPHPQTPERGRPGDEYWLNRTQALVVCILSRAPNAKLIRREVVRVYELAIDGKLETAPGMAILAAAINRQTEIIAAQREEDRADRKQNTALILSAIQALVPKPTATSADIVGIKEPQYDDLRHGLTKKPRKDVMLISEVASRVCDLLGIPHRGPKGLGPQKFQRCLKEQSVVVWDRSAFDDEIVPNPHPMCRDWFCYYPHIVGNKGSTSLDYRWHYAITTEGWEGIKKMLPQIKAWLTRNGGDE
jgi:hypothetical protein